MSKVLTTLGLPARSSLVFASFSSASSSAILSVSHSALKSKTGHLGGDLRMTSLKTHWKFGQGHWNPLYVILSDPAQMSGIFKIHRVQGTVYSPCVIIPEKKLIDLVLVKELGCISCMNCEKQLLSNLWTDISYYNVLWDPFDAFNFQFTISCWLSLNHSKM